jgi:hypothetical protein
MIIAIDIGNTTASVGLIVKKDRAFSALKCIYIPTNTEESGEDLATLIAEELGISYNTVYAHFNPVKKPGKEG